MKEAQIIIGEPVVYWSVILENGEKLNPRRTTIRSEVWNLCGEKVCKVDGVAGGVFINHLEPIKPNPKQYACPEIPFFGATYPDATCIDGQLWDLDKFEDGHLYGGPEGPCPFCQTEQFLEWHSAGEPGAPSRETLLDYIEKMRERYGRKPLTQTT